MVMPPMHLLMMRQRRLASAIAAAFCVSCACRAPSEGRSERAFSYLSLSRLPQERGAILPGARSSLVMRRAVPAPAANSVSFTYTNIPVENTPTGISVHDITPQIRACVTKHFASRRSSQRDGVVHLLSRHTTTALTINEDESRLREDIAACLERLAPSDAPYKHNDLHLRPASEKDRAAIDRNWMSQGKGTLEEFMAQEPKNAHSHLLAMMLGQSETIPVVGGALALGQWQSVLFIDLDGPRHERTVGVQVMG
ncbi:unnamed protein product [Polarella glacialis]|uniref:Secondary thiamine-phosphate synthase enzyme n=1 Tax=Polarella glacialis TaxID=89957 RepID=A0A813KQ64_POLGL|nr:unnamed protein product [Polarella glacialis]